MLNAAAYASELRLPALIGEGMVLQRDLPGRIWGWAEEGATVTVAFRGLEKSARVVDGRWEILLPPMTAGGPWPMTVRSRNILALEKVYVGEVWLCSGQSNMVMPLNRKYVGYHVRGGAAAAARADDPLLRLFTVADVRTNVPQADVRGAWRACTPPTAAEFSAAGYFFGRELRRHLNVPVGLILAARGGSPMEVWMSPGLLERRYPLRQAAMRRRWAQYQQALATGAETRPARPFQPSEYYHGMIHPLLKYAIRGVIWYQGESNVSAGRNFAGMFSDLIGQWRADWGLGDFPFLFVQLAPYGAVSDQPVESSWSVARAEQALVAATVTNTAMAGTVDLGDDPQNPHPVDKETVGRRLSLAARNLVYGEKVAWRGPEFAGLEISGSTAVVNFNHADGGLTTPHDAPAEGFAIAGPDGKFVRADAELKDDAVHVSSTEVAQPAAVRYGWADYPRVNLFNRDGFPAVPFRTDGPPRQP